MAKVSNIDQARPSCEYCGEAAHKKPLMCPRIIKVKYTEEGEIIVYFGLGGCGFIPDHPEACLSAD